MRKATTIRNRIIRLTMCIVIIPLILLIGFSVAASYMTAVNLNSNDMQKIASIASNYVRADFEVYIALAESAGCNAKLASPDVSDAEKLEIMTRLAEQYGAKRGNIVKSDGIEITQGQDFSDREYFIDAMQGKSSIYEPTISRLTGEIIEIVAAPLWKNGEYGTEVVGCTYFITQPEYINDILRELQISENSYAFMLDSQGRVIAHSDTTKVLSDEEVEIPLKPIYEKMIAGETGTTTCSVQGLGRTVISYTDIPGTNGWSIALCAKEHDFLGTLYTINTFMIFLFFITCILAYILTRRISTKIAKPIKDCADILEQVKNGNLSVDIPVVNVQDETKVLADATATLTNNLEVIIHDIKYMLSEMANGNFNVVSQADSAVYCGEFGGILDAINNIHARLNDTLKQINKSADAVSNGAEATSHAAESLSAISEEQASAVDECNASVHAIAEKVGQTAKSCEEGNNLVLQTSECAHTVVGNMNSLQTAMTEINDVSQQIEGIVKTIEDIAFQTNILALNAAVEAARAGSAGKGFAVVADEVRNLAVKSSEAANSTTALIHKTLDAVKKGSEITKKAYNSVNDVDKHILSVKDLVQNIAVDAKEQSEMLVQLNKNFDSISDAVQTEAHAAVESAETAHTMSVEADKLKTLVERFTFDN